MGTVVRPRRATPLRRTTSAPCTRDVAGWGRTTRKLPAGIAVRSNRLCPCGVRTRLDVRERIPGYGVARKKACGGITGRPAQGDADAQKSAGPSAV